MIEKEIINNKGNLKEKNTLVLILEWRYFLFQLVKKAYLNFYKQTVLGPFWNFINPIVFTGVFTIIFGKIAKLPTDGTPPFLFYLTSMVLWSLFQTSLSNNVDNFQTNSAMYKNAYFPRILNPISVIIERLFIFFIQLLVLVFTILFYILKTDYSVFFNFYSIIKLFLIIFYVSILSFSLGLLGSCLNSKYRDIKFIVNFGMQFVFYGTPIVYSISMVPENYEFFYLINPMVYQISYFKYLVIGSVLPDIKYLYSILIFILISLPLSIKYFQYVEKKIDDYV